MLLIIFALLPFLAKSQQVDDKRLFPLMKRMLSKADSMGIEFPKPYCLSAGMYQQNQVMKIKQITVGTFVLNDKDDYVNIDNSSIKNTTMSAQFRADVWVLPFLNIYGMAGRVTTFNDLSLRFNINVPPIPGLTQGDFLTIEREQLVNINGTVLAYGTVLAGGYKKLFINVNLSWARTYLEELDSWQKAFAAFPMLGLQTNLANFFVGAMYLNSGQVNKGSFESEGGQITNYEVKFESKQWNYNVGLNKFIGNWSLNVIQGFGERKSSIIEVGYRF
ncbi:MAG: hypothetical protein JXB49_21925 [Bacteroidales bacterium]|nr:hypothetical protein [Bacteroidales bacterium]